MNNISFLVSVETTHTINLYFLSMKILGAWEAISTNSLNKYFNFVRDFYLLNGLPKWVMEKSRIVLTNLFDFMALNKVIRTTDREFSIGFLMPNKFVRMVRGTGRDFEDNFIYGRGEVFV